MNLTTSTILRRSLAAAAATCALVSVSACGTETAVPQESIGGAAKKAPPQISTLEDCLDTTKQPPVATCPYPIKSGDHFKGTWNRMVTDDEYGMPGR
jgi:hypothetical protein